MVLLSTMVDFIVHIDQHLILLLQEYGSLIYFLLFLIIFGETGLVITPFLPGDSLLFALGSIANEGKVSLIFMIVVLTLAAFLGNTVNYFIGKYFGHSILKSDHKILRKIIKKEYIDDTHNFFDKHGGKAVILSRFFPILRTFTPFIAGIGKMHISKYSLYNFIGGSSWVFLTLTLGYLFGSIPFVKNNFSYIVFGIIGISLVPAIFTVMKAKLRQTI